MANALARRRRLAAALKELRTDRGLTHAKLSSASGVTTTDIARMEAPLAYLNRKPNPDAVEKLAAALGVSRACELWDTMRECAEHGAAHAWWEDRPIGSRQRIFARAEDQALHIAEFGVLPPGLAQHPDYARHRVMVGSPHPSAVSVHAMVEGRERRQRILGGDMTYELVVEEQAVRRRVAPPEVMAAQLDHMLKLAEQPNVSIRVIPVDAELADCPYPQTPFQVITYPDRADPPIVTTDTVTDDLLVTEPEKIDQYARLHRRLCDAALGDEASVAMIRSLAARAVAG